MNVLGDTLESIANNKLGIVKEGVPLCSSVIAPALRTQFSDHVKAKNSTVTFTNFEAIKVKKMDLSGSLFDYKGYKDLELRLLGRHQIENAALVIEAVEILNRKKLYDIPEAALRKGLLTARWVGRAEVMHENPLVIIDGGHNIDAITRMCEFIKYVKSLKGGAYVRGIFAVSADKAKDRMIPILDRTFDELIFTEYNYKRSDDAENIYNISQHPKKSYEENVDLIIERVMKEPDTINVFLGSLYFVSQVRPILEKYQGKK
jgi:dihydrofolate synthase/folylpolyglutamate synthase